MCSRRLLFGKDPRCRRRFAHPDSELDRSVAGCAGGRVLMRVDSNRRRELGWLSVSLGGRW